MNNKSHAEKISDTEQAEILKKAGIEAGKKANRESKALGLSVTFLEGEDIVEISPDGRKRLVSKVDKSTTEIPDLKKGTVLWRK